MYHETGTANVVVAEDVYESATWTNPTSVLRGSIYRVGHAIKNLMGKVVKSYWQDILHDLISLTQHCVEIENTIQRGKDYTIVYRIGVREYGIDALAHDNVLSPYGEYYSLKEARYRYDAVCELTLTPFRAVLTTYPPSKYHEIEWGHEDD